MSNTGFFAQQSTVFGLLMMLLLPCYSGAEQQTIQPVVPPISKSDHKKSIVAKKHAVNKLVALYRSLLQTATRAIDLLHRSFFDAGTKVFIIKWRMAQKISDQRVKRAFLFVADPLINSYITCYFRPIYWVNKWFEIGLERVMDHAFSSPRSSHDLVNNGLKTVATLICLTAWKYGIMRKSLKGIAASRAYSYAASYALPIEVRQNWFAGTILGYHAVEFIEDLF